MHKTIIPKTNLNVSDICLGTASFGNSITQDECFRQLDFFIEKGCNFIDTARVYGNSEFVLGKYIESRKCRNNIIISTKGAHPDIKSMDIPRMNPDEIKSDLYTSLNMLKTDYIDLYFLHRDDKNKTVCEIIDCLEDICKTGYIRYYGCSNWTLPRIIEANEYAQKSGAKGFVSNQVMLSLTKANKDFFEKNDMIQADNETLMYHKNSNMNLMAYMALAGGYFIKRYKCLNISDNAKTLYANKDNDDMFDKIKNICVKTGYSVIDIMLHYVLLQDFSSIPIVAFGTTEQMDTVLDSLERKISKKDLDILFKKDGN